MKGIPKGQFLRLHRNCSDPCTFRTQSRDLGDRFLRRGYPQDIIAVAYKGALKRDHISLFNPHTKEMDRENKTNLRIIGQFDMPSRKVRDIMEKHWGILLLDETLGKLLPKRPLITFQHGRSIQDRLVNSHFKIPQKMTWLDRAPNGCYQYGNCKFC